MAPATGGGRDGPRKQPRQARAVDTVDAIVEAAARILEERGHAGFSTNAVAARAGVSVGSLYQYFPNKDALVGALLRRETGLLVDEADEAAGQATGSAALSGLIAACIAHQFRRPGLARLLDFEEARLPGAPDLREVGAAIDAIAARILGRPDLPAQPDPAVAARDVVAIIKGMVDGAGQRGETTADDLAGRVARAVFGYLGARRPSSRVGR